jgi:linoleoyl-CoA desaturase
MMSTGNLYLFYAAYTGVGLSTMFIAFNVSHDAAHGVAVKSKRWNKILFNISFNLVGNNAYIWGSHHNDSHHLYTNVEGSDIDVLDNPLTRLTPTQRVRWYHKYQQFYIPFMYLFYSLNWFLFRETGMLLGFTSRTIDIKMPWFEVVKLIFFKLFYIFYMIVLPCLLKPHGWGHVLAAFIIQHFVISLIFVAVLGVSHLSDLVRHPLPDANGQLYMSWPKLQLLTCVDYNADSRILNFVLGGFNAHALHHLLPDVSHVHYLKLVKIFRQTCRDYNLQYHDVGYLAALTAHFRFLRDMGRADHSPRTQFLSQPK